MITSFVADAPSFNAIHPSVAMHPSVVVKCPQVREPSPLSGFLRRLWFFAMALRTVSNLRLLANLFPSPSGEIY